MGRSCLTYDIRPTYNWPSLSRYDNLTTKLLDDSLMLFTILHGHISQWDKSLVFAPGGPAAMLLIAAGTGTLLPTVATAAPPARQKLRRRTVEQLWTRNQFCPQFPPRQAAAAGRRGPSCAGRANMIDKGGEAPRLTCQYVCLRHGAGRGGGWGDLTQPT